MKLPSDEFCFAREHSADDRLLLKLLPAQGLGHQNGFAAHTRIFELESRLGFDLRIADHALQTLFKQSAKCCLAALRQLFCRLEKRARDFNGGFPKATRIRTMGVWPFLEKLIQTSTT